MKKMGLLGLVGLVFLAVACSNDFDLTAKWKDIPVVYAFIDRQDTAHYVRVEKAFLDPTKSALQIAQIPDSLYYANATVFFERSNGQRFQLKRVDGNLEGFPRDSGVFAQSPNFLYKIKRSDINLLAGEELKIVIDRGDNLPLVTGKTTVLSDISLKTPSKSSTNIQFKSDADFKFRWQVGQEAQIFNVSAVVRVRELNLTTFQSTIRSIPWSVIQNFKRENTSTDVNAQVAGSAFFLLIKNNFQPDANLQRNVVSIDFRVDGGGHEINDYNDVLNANAGLSGAELIPVYTNMSEGYGLFTSRGYTEELQFVVNQTTIDSLKEGQYTKGLGFK